MLLDLTQDVAQTDAAGQSICSRTWTWPEQLETAKVRQVSGEPGLSQHRQQGIEQDMERYLTGELQDTAGIKQGSELMTADDLSAEIRESIGLADHAHD